MDDPEQPSGRPGDDTVATEASGGATSPRAGGDAGAAGGPYEAIGRYELRAVLGSGGMGIVYDAWDPQLRRRVAVKLVRPDRADDGAHARMLREAQALAQISHPNVVAVHDVGEHGGEVYVATELVDGETLFTWQPGKPKDDIVRAWIQVARGLAAAHAVGVVHRDVKPANALVGRDGRVRIGDFGLAKLDPTASSPDARPASGRTKAPTAPAPPAGLVVPVSGEATTALGDAPGSGSLYAGTPAYMAPEQRRGEFDARSDQFALCVALAEALTGRRPAPDDAVDVAPDRLAAALRRGLRRDPAQRFPEIDQLADALALAIEPPSPRARRSNVILYVAGLGTLALAAVVTWTVVRSTRAAGCQVAQVPDDLWPASRRSAFDHSLAANVVPRVDKWIAAWSTASADVCTTDRDRADVQARRRECLAEQLSETRQVLDGWDQEPDPLLVQGGLDRLPRPARCASAVVLRTSQPGADQRARMEAVRAQISAAALSGNTVAAVDTVTRLVEDVRAIGHVPFTIEAMAELAALQVQRDAAAAQATLRAAIAEADRAHDDLSRLDVMVALVRAMRPDDIDQAVGLADSGRALNAELGGDPVVDAQLDQAVGNLYSSRSQPDEAVAAFERARRGFRAAYGADSVSEAFALYGLGSAYASRDPTDPRGKATIDAGAAMLRVGGVDLLPGGEVLADADSLIAAARLQLAWARRLGPESETTFTGEYNLGLAYSLKDADADALAQYQRAIAIGERLHLRDPRLAEAYSQVAMMLLDLKRPEEALIAARRAVAMAEDLAMDSELGYALTALGRAELDTGDPAAARVPLERSLEIRDRLKESSQQRGYTRFLLARAMVGTDPKRARALAEAGRLDIKAFADAIRPGDPFAERNRSRMTARLAEIDRWLLDHP